MVKAEFTTIFWNVWFYTQDGRVDKGARLIKRLGDLITEHHPDVIGLNEVLVNLHDKSSPVMDFLTKNKYHCHLAAFSPTDDNWMVGNLLATKQKPLVVQEHVLGADAQAERRGYSGCTIKAIYAELKFNDMIISTLLNYMCSLYPYDWATHIGHRKKYENVVRSIFNKNLIIGGDFNETKFMLPWLRLTRPFKRKTGTLLNPTWRLNGKTSHLAFANYDNVVYREDGDLNLRNFKVLDRRPSDHAPLLAVFEVG